MNQEKIVAMDQGDLTLSEFRKLFRETPVELVRYEQANNEILIRGRQQDLEDAIKYVKKDEENSKKPEDPFEGDPELRVELEKGKKDKKEEKEDEDESSKSLQDVLEELNNG